MDGNENEGCNLRFVTSFSYIGGYGVFIGTCYLKMVAGSTDTRQTFT